MISLGYFYSTETSTVFLQWKGEQVEQVFILVVDPSANGVKEEET